jgi:hypothetical protein
VSALYRSGENGSEIAGLALRVQSIGKLDLNSVGSEKTREIVPGFAILQCGEIITYDLNI